VNIKEHAETDALVVRDYVTEGAPGEWFSSTLPTWNYLKTYQDFLCNRLHEMGAKIRMVTSSKWDVSIGEMTRRIRFKVNKKGKNRR